MNPLNMEALLTEPAATSHRTQTSAPARPRVRVLHLINSFESGGTERQAVELLKRLDQTRFDVRLGAIQNIGPLYAEIAAQYPQLHEFRLNSLYNANTLRQVLKLRALLRTEAIDILHAHDFYAGWLGALAAQFTSVKFIACQRHLRLSDRWVHAFGRRIINGLAERVIVNADLIRQYVLEVGTAAAEKIVVIHNGLSFEATLAERPAVRAALCRELGLPDTVKLIGSVANLRPVKGHRYLIQALATVVRQFPQAHLVLIGEGELRETLQTQINELGLAAHIHLLGQRRDAARLAQAFDLSVLASLHEGLPNTVMEALAAQVPVIATAVGGVLELVREGETGYLVPAADPARLAEQMLYALTNEAESAARAARGRAFVLEQFSMQRMVAATEQLYDELGRRSQ
jgi:glycosyltransferase involved in cell wall biosynthesis